MDLEETLSLLAARPAEAPFAYVVTPNADHFIRLEHSEPGLRPVYEGAWLSVCDSRVLRLLAARRGIALKLAPGSDLTVALLERVLAADEPLTVLGGNEEVVGRVIARYGLTKVAHHNPPMGFIDDPVAVAACEDFVAAHPARFVLLCLGSPRQEILAARIAAGGRARGVGLCVGAALEFAAGVKQRAPIWVQKAHLEWLHRLLSEPRRLWRRYLLEAPRLLMLMRRVPRQRP